MRTSAINATLALVSMSIESFGFILPSFPKPSFMSPPVPQTSTLQGLSSHTPLDTFNREHTDSITDPNTYWSDIAATLQWDTSPTKALTGSFLEGDVKWFQDGTLNACVNSLDRHAVTQPDKTAILYEGDDPSLTEHISYAEALKRTSVIANMLTSNGVKRGDVVTLYMPMTPTVIFTMLACARIGAVHSVIFAGFSDDAIADRIASAGSKFVVTADGGVRGGRNIPLKKTIDSALGKDRAKAVVEKLFVFQRTMEDVPLDATRDILVTQDYLDTFPTTAPYAVMNAEDPLFILYTSGSTGSPKGIVHTTGGYLTYALHTTATSFDLRPDDVYACVADAGWITGHTYVAYGPLLKGATSVVFESTPLYPDEGRYWDMIERHKISVFYTAPTAIRSLMRFGDEPPKKYDLSSLRVLGSVGEPINPAAWDWYHDVIGGGKAEVVDTYWQTETGGHVCLNVPGVHEAKAGSCRGGTYGIDLAILDPKSGAELTGNGVEGVLVIKQPWPGVARTCLGDHDRFMATYLQPYPGYYFAGDGARRDEDGYVWVTGRVDDVINTSGHRIGTAEVESALVAHPACSQAAVVGYAHDVKGEGICCYVTLTNGFEWTPELQKELKMAVRGGIGAFATPDLIVHAPALPLTRSGKIMRRILRKIAAGEVDSLGDTSTLADPSCVEKLISGVEAVKAEKAKK